MNKIKAWSAGTANKKTTAIVAIIIVVAILGVSWYFFGRSTSPHATFAPQGQVISGFPKTLILDNTAAIDNSYTIGYSANLNQYTANWTSASSSLDSLYGKYLSYFTQNGWTVTNSSTNITGFRGLYAVNPSADANVTMSDVGTGGLRVTVSYVKK